MGIRPSITPVYGKNSIDQRVLLSHNKSGRTESQIKSGKYPKTETPKSKDKGNAGRSLKQSTKPTQRKAKPFGFKRK